MTGAVLTLPTHTAIEYGFCLLALLILLRRQSIALRRRRRRRYMAVHRVRDDAYR